MYGGIIHLSYITAWEKINTKNFKNIWRDVLRSGQLFWALLMFVLSFGRPLLREINLWMSNIGIRISVHGFVGRIGTTSYGKGKELMLTIWRLPFCTSASTWFSGNWCKN